MSDIQPWLQSLGLEKYIEVMASHDIDLSVAPDLTEQDLEKLGLSLGHRRKFLAAAAKLRTTALSSEPATTVRQAAPSAPPAERRQLTVAFVDLVGSTALGTELDPEDLIILLAQYREACESAIARHDGYVAQYLGDGILVYFGFPHAQEDAAERAVRAGLEITARIAELKRPDGLPLQTRVGIATGLVVVGEPPHVGTAGAETVVGDTPNLAARLQAMAEPGWVLVGPATHRLTSDFFEYSFVGQHAFKGFSEPVPVWRVLRESAAESRFAAAHSATANPIVGRDRELAFLHDSWQRTTQGNGHVVLLVGEAGIGKSRLLEALAERVHDAPHRLLRCQCSPYHRNSALFPFRVLLRNRLGINRDISAAKARDHIDRMLEQIGGRDRTSALLLAELLEVPRDEQVSPAEMTANQRREATLSILVDLLIATPDVPVLLFVEDAHWSDQTTQALVDRLLKRVEHEAALVLITYRPELKTEWSRHPNATLVACKQIGPEPCALLVRNVSSRMQIDNALIREIVSRSDGVPLFAEELTKTVLEMRSVSPGAVPLTLRDSLMARLDRLGGAKDIAQIASVLGRQFSRAWLKAIAGANDEQLGSALSRLRETGLIFDAGGDGEASCIFNHSLVQEAAYESLPRSRRQSLHKMIAEHFETGPVAESEPSLVAHHYSRAGESEKSFHFWMRAADQAGQRLALAECMANLNSALTEAERVADPRTRMELKLEAQLKVGATLAIQKGPQNDETEQALAKAEKLAREANAGPQLFQATWGLYLNAARNSRLDRAKILGEELNSISQTLGDEDLKFEALHHRWGYAFFTGQTPIMLEGTAKGLQQYDRNRHHKFSYVYAGHDPGVCAYCVRSLGLALAGRARSVKPTLQAGFELAASLHHPLSVAFAQSLACFAFHLVRDSVGCQQAAEELLKTSDKYDFPVTRGVATFMIGAARALQGDAELALKQMEPAFEAAHAFGFLGMLPGIIMAETLVGAGRDKDALALVTRLLDGISTPEIGVFVCELWRLRGELMLRLGAADTLQCKRYMATALRMATEQGAPILQLKAATSLARLLANSGRRDEASTILDRSQENVPDEWEGPETAAALQLRSGLG
jgi:class 3 adenylate cyclase